MNVARPNIHYYWTTNCNAIHKTTPHHITSHNTVHYLSKVSELLQKVFLSFSTYISALYNMYVVIVHFRIGQVKERTPVGGRRERGRKGGRKEGREEKREGGKEGEREGGKERGREGGREAESRERREKEKETETKIERQ